MMMEAMGSEFCILTSGKCGPSQSPFGDLTPFTGADGADALEFQAIGSQLCSLRREANLFDGARDPIQSKGANT